MRALNYAKNSGNFVGKWNASRSIFVRSDWNVWEHQFNRSDQNEPFHFDRLICCPTFLQKITKSFHNKMARVIPLVWLSSFHLTIRKTPYHFVRSGKDDGWGARRNLPGMNIGPSRSAFLVILSNEKVDKIFALKLAGKLRTSLSD